MLIRKKETVGLQTSAVLKGTEAAALDLSRCVKELRW
jgi:hypothetical protein